jgi:hypothetical protein
MLTRATARTSAEHRNGVGIEDDGSANAPDRGRHIGVRGMLGTVTSDA